MIARSSAVTEVREATVARVDPVNRVAMAALQSSKQTFCSRAPTSRRGVASPAPAARVAPAAGVVMEEKEETVTTASSVGTAGMAVAVAMEEEGGWAESVATAAASRSQ